MGTDIKMILSRLSRYLPLSGGTMSGNLDLDGHDLTAGDITSTGDKYSISKDSGSPGYYAYGYNNSGSVNGILQMSKARGTEASPTAIQSGDRAGGVYSGLDIMALALPIHPLSSYTPPRIIPPAQEARK